MTDNSIDLAPTLNFLRVLGANNNKVWFEANREAYDSARAAFADFVDTLIDRLRREDKLGDLAAGDCMTRIHRDVRFSKDKSPYKTSMGAAIAPGGRKSSQLGYHIYLTPEGQSLVAGGLYMPSGEQLAQFRATVAADAAPFKKLLRAKELVAHFGGVSGERLKTAPQGYSREHPEIELLQLKQVTVVHHYPDAEVVADDFLNTVEAACQAMKPFLRYLDKVAGGSKCY